MHMLSRKDLNSAELETVKVSTSEIQNAQKKWKNCILFAYRWVVFAGRIHNKTRGSRAKHAYGQQEWPQLCRNGHREDIEKFDDGGDSQRRGANNRGGNSVCQGNGFIRANDASWRHTGSSLTWKTLRGSRIFLPLDQWSETTSHQKWQKSGMQHGFWWPRRLTMLERNTANFVPFVVPGLSTSSSSSSSPTSSQEAVTPTEHPASTRSGSMGDRVRRDPSRGPAETANSPKKHDNEGVRGNPLRDLPE